MCEQALPAEFTREKVIEFLALIITGGKQSTISREQCLGLLLQIAVDRGNTLADRFGALELHAKLKGLELTECGKWAALSVLTNSGTGSL
jgi:hypothetical protein